MELKYSDDMIKNNILEYAEYLKDNKTDKLVNICAQEGLLIITLLVDIRKLLNREDNRWEH